MKAHEQFLSWPKLEPKLNALSIAMSVNDVPVIRSQRQELVSGYQPDGEVVEPSMPILGFVLFSGRTIWVTEEGVHLACLRLARFFILLYHETSRYFMMVMMMTTATREKFSSQAAPEVLLALRNIAENQGRQFQAVLDDALRDYIDRQQKESPRRHVMAAFASSMDEFDHLYRELAK